MGRLELLASGALNLRNERLYLFESVGETARLLAIFVARTTWRNPSFLGGIHCPPTKLSRHPAPEENTRRPGPKLRVNDAASVPVDLPDLLWAAPI
jgi:hypothetical protein